ncbi:MAG: hypothetical protein HN348_32265, partial [Proteobacteria bacterium]|nr:hypothetical protein [Pseudomonadota bacterium]
VDGFSFELDEVKALGAYDRMEPLLILVVAALTWPTLCLGKMIGVLILINSMIFALLLARRYRDGWFTGGKVRVVVNAQGIEFGTERILWKNANIEHLHLTNSFVINGHFLIHSGMDPLLDLQWLDASLNQLQQSANPFGAPDDVPRELDDVVSSVSRRRRQEDRH